MSKFFNVQTRSLHVVESYAGAVKLPQYIAAHAPKVNEVLREDTPPFEILILRRQMAGNITKQFFSTNTHTLFRGNYYCSSTDNTDLIPVESVNRYR